MRSLVPNQESTSRTSHFESLNLSRQHSDTFCSHNSSSVAVTCQPTLLRHTQTYSTREMGGCLASGGGGERTPEMKKDQSDPLWRYREAGIAVDISEEDKLFLSNASEEEAEQALRSRCPDPITQLHKEWRRLGLMAAPRCEEDEEWWSDINPPPLPSMEVMSMSSDDDWLRGVVKRRCGEGVSSQLNTVPYNMFHMRAQLNGILRYSIKGWDNMLNYIKLKRQENLDWAKTHDESGKLLVVEDKNSEKSSEEHVKISADDAVLLSEETRKDHNKTVAVDVAANNKTLEQGQMIAEDGTIEKICKDRRNTVVDVRVFKTRDDRGKSVAIETEELNKNAPNEQGQSVSVQNTIVEKTREQRDKALAFETKGHSVKIPNKQESTVAVEEILSDRTQEVICKTVTTDAEEPSKKSCNEPNNTIVIEDILSM